jgi:hypothetical protein
MTMGSACISDRYACRVGERIGSLTFAGIADERGDNNRLFGRFVCDCGNETIMRAGLVLNGKGRAHCGCKRDFGAHRKHGMRSSREYSSWQAMKARCLDPANKDYPRWGGAGITVCEDWIASFDAFYSHIGPRPEGTSIDRIDTEKGYCPGNVRWATPSEQARNRHGASIWKIKGLVFQSHSEAATHFGVSRHTVWRWVHGQFDARRNSFTNPRSDCYVIPRY